MSTQKEKKFIEVIEENTTLLFASSILGSAIEWIVDNLEPEEIYDVERFIKPVQKHYHPETVYSEFELHAWAEKNGYVKK